VKSQRRPAASTNPQAEDVRPEVRRCQRWAIVFGAFFVLVGLPFAGNFGKGGPPILDPDNWAPWVGIVGSMGVASGVGAIVLVIVAGSLEDSSQRPRRKSRKGTP